MRKPCSKDLDFNDPSGARPPKNGTHSTPIAAGFKRETGRSRQPEISYCCGDGA